GKCVKYGGMTEDEALRTITLNGAKQLGLDKRTGSIEVGKDGDLAIFNGHPLNSYSRCEMTVVDGEIYFQRSDKLTPFTPAAAAPAKAAPPFKAPSPGLTSYVLNGATVHPVTGPALENHRVVVRDGRIAKLEPASSPAADSNGLPVIEAAGLHLYPGM